MRSSDTSAAMHDKHIEAQRTLGEAGRFRAALELSDLVHSFAVAGIRQRDPSCTEHEAPQKLAELLYRDPLVALVQ